MKLRNKKTGKIIEKYPDGFVLNSGEQIRQYNSLSELDSEWEDYEDEGEKINEEIVEKALAGIRSAWKNMLAAEDKETFDAWSKETKEIQKILNQEKRKKYRHEYYLRVTKPKREERRIKNE